MSTQSTMFNDMKLDVGKFDNEFADEVGPIGGGGFGIVTKARHRSEQIDYAIKKIKISDSEQLKKRFRERDMWLKLDSDYFVKYRNSWLEMCDDRTEAQFSQYKQFNIHDEETVAADELDNSGDPNEVKLQPRQYAILHLQMELCWFTLREAMEMCGQYLGIAGNPNQPLPPIGYFIASEMLLEILTSINYLHEYVHEGKPYPILHRDINPNNILIKAGSDGRFIKVSDFGCAVEHVLMKSTHSANVGTIRYMAPEINQGRYDTKADVYSIGVTVQEMFNLDINSKVELTGRYRKLSELSVKSIDGMRHRRPTCADWLAVKNDQCLGAGGFGVVIKGRNKIDEKDYAIKMIFILDDDENSLRTEILAKIREIKIWAKLSSDRYVQYRSAWLEGPDDECRNRFVNHWYDHKTGSGSFDKTQVEFMRSLYLQAKHYRVLNIQMDLCQTSLTKVLADTRSHFDRP
ncbi:unnamed protein product, partial [Medioppia subpectinata]